MTKEATTGFVSTFTEDVNPGTHLSIAPNALLSSKLLQRIRSVFWYIPKPSLASTDKLIRRPQNQPPRLKFRKVLNANLTSRKNLIVPRLLSRPVVHRLFHGFRKLLALGFVSSTDICFSSSIARGTCGGRGRGEGLGGEVLGKAVAGR